MKLSPNTIASLEAIAFQDGKLFKEIVTIFEKLRSEKPEQTFWEKFFRKRITDIFEKTKLSDIVFKATGIKIKVAFDASAGFACVNIPRLTSGNVLLNHFRGHPFFDSEGEVLLKDNRSDLKGAIDLNTSTVSGIFSQGEYTIFFAPDFFYNDKYTVEEMAGIFLHELGHVFTYFEFLTETVTTNLALMTVVNRALKATEYSERKVILTNAATKFDFQIPDVEKLSTSEDGKSVYLVLMGARIEKLRSSIGTSVYDAKSWEFLADQFAVRHGAGRHLSSAMFKIGRDYSGATRSQTTQIFMLALEAIFLVAGLLSTYSFFAIYLIVAGMFIDTSPHDKCEQRIQRMRQGLVEDLKNKDITPERKEELLSDIKIIDTYLDKVTDYSSLIDIFWDYVRPAKRDAKKQYDFQLQLEKLSANSLYVNAAKLSTMA